MVLILILPQTEMRFVFYHFFKNSYRFFLFKILAENFTLDIFISNSSIKVQAIKIKFIS